MAGVAGVAKSRETLRLCSAAVQYVYPEMHSDLADPSRGQDLCVLLVASSQALYCTV